MLVNDFVSDDENFAKPAVYLSSWGLAMVFLESFSMLMACQFGGVLI
ncbi:hypothetical protein [Moraxella bovoculi]|nr:hypothetical protein [Moraxella bovoculi]